MLDREETKKFEVQYKTQIKALAGVTCKAFVWNRY